ncbi:putative short-subunit dehydrogenase-like oxidoreductase (DUF2520 family) [Lewinella marina]|uniref:DUF2520 domain-containing protein n=1 Tax=Neolewinella marina TaxID=438751 RepID=A0A2G0CF02_9BACT|nr:DUF2520 domain-containing protein [Neolewinella marina]NJB85769.1 putative short-subunit dehydrogenase-like oxidoreductase (DUF2520 family) [Neolewinella marina]PHK98558.1 hypothetical protein CGL56_08775 [Neolewinella marina]
MGSPNIAIVGNGNLAWHLSGVLGDRAVVASRSASASTVTYQALAGMSLDAVFLAVPDNRIAQTSEELSGLLPPTLPVFHTSGATPADRISNRFCHRGVLWPIRSLRRGEPVTHWRDLPLVIYATTEPAGQLLRRLAGDLSDSVTWLDDRQRAQLHLAAVFSNNFVTALYEIAFQLCRQHDIPFELLLPIIRHTAGSQDGQRPALRQTGAAARGDSATMDRHLSLLDQPEYQKLYRDISHLILQYRLSEHDPHLGRDANDDLEDEGVA